MRRLRSGLHAAPANPGLPPARSTSPSANACTPSPRWRGSAGLVGLLLDKGADVNDADNDAGASPLHIAAANGDAEITNLLLARQANPSIEEKNGRIPLEIAQAILPSEHVVVKILRQREEVEK
jgi:ankyrin repeat protein